MVNRGIKLTCMAKQVRQLLIAFVYAIAFISDPRYGNCAATRKRST